MNTRTRESRRRGATSLEMGLVLPFILIMILGMVEAGNMYYSWMTIQKAAQNGARFAATGLGEEQGNRLLQIEGVTIQLLDTLNKGDKEIFISSWPTTNTDGPGRVNNPGGPCEVVEVAVIYHYRPFTPLVGDFLPDIIDLAANDRKFNEPWKPCGE